MRQQQEEVELSEIGLVRTIRKGNFEPLLNRVKIVKKQLVGQWS